MKLIALLTFATMAVSATASAQTATPPRDGTDAEKIADALRAGPAFITKDATILDWPSTADGEYRVLRKGTSEWTDRKSTRLNSSHLGISYAVFCLKKKRIKPPAAGKRQLSSSRPTQSCRGEA